MAHRHSVYDTDSHFIIDPITREIVNTASRKTTLIQGDHNSERFTFEIKRLIEGHDMSQCNKIEIHYTNGDSDGVYIVDDTQISPNSNDVVIFSWLIDMSATMYTGIIAFAIRFSCLTDSTVDYAWHTGIHTGISVSEGKNNGEAILRQYSDVLAEWETRINGVYECFTYAKSSNLLNLETVTHNKTIVEKEETEDEEEQETLPLTNLVPNGNFTSADNWNCYGEVTMTTEDNVATFTVTGTSIKATHIATNPISTFEAGKRYFMMYSHLEDNTAYVRTQFELYRSSNASSGMCAVDNPSVVANTWRTEYAIATIPDDYDSDSETVTVKIRMRGNSALTGYSHSVKNVMVICVEDFEALGITTANAMAEFITKNANGYVDGTQQFVVESEDSPSESYAGYEIVDDDYNSLTDFIEVKPFEKFIFSYKVILGYRINSNLTIHCFDSEKNYISSEKSTTASTPTSSSQNAAYARFSLRKSCITEDKKPCLKRYTDPNTTYEEYYEGTRLKVKGYPVDFDETALNVKIAHLEAEVEDLKKNGVSGGTGDSTGGDISDGSNNSSSGGISPEATSLLVTILRSAVYTSDQTSNIEALVSALQQTNNDAPLAEGINQIGTVLTITSGVNATQSGDVLSITSEA